VLWLQLFISANAKELHDEQRYYEALRVSIIDSRRVAMTEAELVDSTWDMR
jgi:hypothetical protein